MRATSSHAAAAPPSSDMNARRLRSSMSYCESPSQIERAGGLELPFGKRSAASQHGGPVSPFELVTAQLRHDVLHRDHACARSAWGCGLVLEADGGDTRPARNLEDAVKYRG